MLQIVLKNNKKSVSEFVRESDYNMFKKVKRRMTDYKELTEKEFNFLDNIQHDLSTYNIKKTISLKTETVNKKALSQRQIVEFFPSLISHLICESLGYLTPRSASNVIYYYIREEGFACEMISSNAGRLKGKKGPCFDDSYLTQATKDFVENTWKNRDRHSGYMQDYNQAKKIVKRYLKKGKTPVLASWF